MIELLNGLVDTAKKDKKQFMALKNLAVKCQQFELSCQIMEMEKELFPESEEEKNAKDKARELNLLFRMVDLNVTEDICWLIGEAIKMHSQMEGKFSIRDAAELVSKKQQIFDNI